MRTYTINADNDITQYASANEADAQAEVNTERFSASVGLAELAARWPIARLVGIWNGLPGVAPVKKFTDRKTAVARIWKVVENFSKVGSTPVPTLSEVAPAPESTPPPSAPAPQSASLQTAPAPAPADELVQPLSAPVAAIDANQTAPSPQAASELIPKQAEAAISELQTHPEPAAPAAESEAVARVAAQAADVAPTEPPPAKKPTRTTKTPTAAAKAKGPRAENKTDLILGMLRRPGGATLGEIMVATSWQAHSVRGFVSGVLMKKMALMVVSVKSTSGERTYAIIA